MEAEAEARLRAEGPNVLPAGGKRGPLKRIVDVLRQPMLSLLLGAGLIYALLGDIREAAVLLVFAGFSIVITIVQEGRADRAIEALREMSMPVVTVIRDGERRSIPSRELVRGDLLEVAEGSRVAADGWVIETDLLQADESALTGESVPVSKRAAMSDELEKPPLPGGEGLAYVFSGTLVVRGHALVRAAATGPRSRIGQIGQSLTDVAAATPRLAAQARVLVKWSLILGLAVSVLATLLYGLLRGGWLEALLSGIAITMSMLPEELPVVLAIFMTMGALRMSRVRVLARRGAAIEALGSATVLCTDKTGTLTQNRMRIAELRLPDGRSQPIGDDGGNVLDEGFVELAGLGILASLEQAYDPMETAFHDLGREQAGSGIRRRQRAGWTRRKEYGLTPDLLAVSHVWGRDGEGEHVVATKGAPEAIAELCGMDAARRRQMDAAVAAMAEHGLRVLGVAEARWTGSDLPDSPHAFDLTYRGLVGLADPIREDVPEAVAELQRAGIRVVMITGDYPATARAIAGQAGIAAGEVLAADDLAHLDDAALAAKGAHASVFARVMPEHKLRIVAALRSAGETVAMIGDGVNDAPSLKAADIGVAMGRRGTDVAREAAAIVLLDDDFGAIPKAVRLGRRIYDNIRKATAFIVAVHIPIAGVALAPLLLGWPVLLGPIHIALLEMIIDPVCSLAFEAEPGEADIMERPPRDPAAALFPRRMLAWSVLQGVTAAALLLLLVAWQVARGVPAAELRSINFAALAAAVVVLVETNRSFAPSRFGAGRNTPLLAIIAAVAVILTALFEIHPLAQLLGLSVLGPGGIVSAAAAAMLLFASLRLLKPRFARTFAR